MTVPSPLPPMTTSRPREPAPPLCWPLLSNPAAKDGRLIFPSLAESIVDLVKVILLTSPGEQLMRPEFGAGIQRFLHEPNTLQTRARIREAVQAALGRFEARIELVSVDVERGSDPSEADVLIIYRCRFTGRQETLALVTAVGAG